MKRFDRGRRSTSSRPTPRVRSSPRSAQTWPKLIEARIEDEVARRQNLDRHRASVVLRCSARIAGSTACCVDVEARSNGIGAELAARKGEKLEARIFEIAGSESFNVALDEAAQSTGPVRESSSSPSSNGPRPATRRRSDVLERLAEMKHEIADAAPDRPPQASGQTHQHVHATCSWRPCTPRRGRVHCVLSSRRSATTGSASSPPIPISSAHPSKHRRRQAHPTRRSSRRRGHRTGHQRRLESDRAARSSRTSAEDEHLIEVVHDRGRRHPPANGGSALRRGARRCRRSTSATSARR